MKRTTLNILLLLFATIGCRENANLKNNFTSQNDTLYLESVKLKGYNLFNLGAGFCNTKLDSTSTWTIASIGWAVIGVMIAI